MSRKLDDFISKIKTTGIAHPHLFTVSIMPDGVGGVSSKNNILLDWASKDTDDICLMCSSTHLPDNTMMTTQSKTYGISPEMPYEKPSGTLSMSFYVLADFDVIKFFNHWILAVYDPTTGLFGFKNDYIAKISVTMESPELVKEYQVDYFECYPKTIQQITLNSQHEATPMVVNVDFVYTYSKEVKIREH